MAPRHHALRESPRVQEIAVNEEIDWAKLARELGLSAPYGEYCCGSDDAQRALEQIIGEDALRAIVDYYVDCRLVHHWLARFFGGCGPGVRCAVGMRYSRVPKQSRTGEPPSSFCVWVADRRALPWIPEFFEDEDGLIQAWGAGVLDQLLWSELVEQEEAEELLRTAEQHSNQSVRERTEFVRGYLRSRAEASKERRDDDGCCGE